MPKIKIDHIISFSSEDPVHVANNILSGDTTKKWKIQKAGEKNAVVVIQLEKACVITGIDIGNEHSAYVEVLVSRSGTNDDFKVLLVTSSFMTPLEARQSQNINKVRMFTKDQLSKPECDEKWDRIKIVCTQPFNKHVQYGLSFINLHTTESKNVAAPVQTNIGKFTLRPDSPDNLSAGSLFAKRKEQKQDEKLTGAAAIREASSTTSLAKFGSPVCKPKLKNQNVTPNSKKDSTDDSENIPRPRNRNELLYSKDEEEPNEKIDKIMEKKAKEKKEKELEIDKEKANNNKRNSDKTRTPTSSRKNKKENSRESPKPLDISINSPGGSKIKDTKKADKDRKRKHDADTKDQNKRPKKDVVTKPFASLLEGVTLVISGIQNPDRGNLRSLALSMGAKYKADWDDSCTHLICAFPNTPKFSQVQGKGKIVKRKWLEDCHSQRKRLPWRRYALDKNDIGKDESEDEICETTKNASPVNSRSTTDVSNDEADDYSEHKEEGSDTEERIARIQEKQRQQKANNHDSDIYIVDTDEEDPSGVAISTITDKLKNFLTNKKFYIDQTLDDVVYENVFKYVVAYNGKSIDNPIDKIDVIITTQENSQSLKEVNTTAVCLSPDWVWECHNRQKLVPMDDFEY